MTYSDNTKEGKEQKEPKDILPKKRNKREPKREQHRESNDTCPGAADIDRYFLT